MVTINPYLTFLGNCEEAFNYYKSVFGGEFTSFDRFGDMPPQEGITPTEEQKNQIMHVSLPISKETVLMGSDTGGEWAPNTVVGNNFSLSVNAETKQQADHFFERLSNGGQVTMPIDKTFWGSYFGMCTDKFGINWMVSFGENQEE
jgi:PhnB protein